MPKRHRPRHGSWAFRPRARHKKRTPSIAYWPSQDGVGLLGFAGYKAGMTHLSMIDDDVGSPTIGHEIAVPVTVVETPPIFVFGLRAYEKTPYGSRVLMDAHSAIADKKAQKKLTLPKKANENLKKIEEAGDKVSDVSILVHTYPGKTGFGKKRPEAMEIARGGKSAREKLEFAKGLLGKEVSAKDVLKEGEYVDAIAISKGKGWQGAVKRFGVEKQRRKATGKVRHVGTLGPWHPPFVMYTVPMAGQTGYHKRTEHNKRVLKVAAASDKITPKGGFVNYGVVKTDYLLLKGSLPGPMKRLIRFRKSVRNYAQVAKPDLKYISLESKQGS